MISANVQSAEVCGHAVQCIGFVVKIEKYYVFIYLFIYCRTDIDNTSNTNKNNKMPAKDRKVPEGTLTSTLINTI